MKVVVEVLAGGRAGQRFTFDKPRSVRFGRHPDNDVAFDANADRDASSRHAELRLVREGYRLFDLGSANGTFDGDKKLPDDGLSIATRAEVRFGASGPRCRIEVIDEKRAVVPVTIHRTGEPITEPDALAAKKTLPDDDTNVDKAPPVLTGFTPHALVKPDTPRRFGEKTVAGIVAEALRRQEGKNHRRAIAVGVTLALLASGLGAAVALGLRSRPSMMKRELAALIEAQRTANDDERARLQQKIDDLSRRLGRGVQIPKENHDAVFLVVARASESDGFCTAFAVTKTRLLTNAHCVQVAEEMHHKGAKIEIVPNGGGSARDVIAWKKSSGFHASSARIGTDVGWLEVEDPLPKLVTIAPQDVLEAITAGDGMSTYGFPGRLADSSAPEATYVAGVIGRVTTLDGRPGSPAERQLLQHSAFTTAGTSGSPLFDADGRVIGINAGGYVDDSAAGRPLSGYNFAMRIDLAEPLLKEAEQ